MQVIDKYVSIDGEGPTAGALSAFIRFAGCNLRCPWCDTSYAWDAAQAEEVDEAALAAWVRSTSCLHVTLTGGEPLLQPKLIPLLARLNDYEIHIETNGSLPIQNYRLDKNIHFIVDYKLPSSGMEEHMLPSNLTAVQADDAYKFVLADEGDLNRAIEVIRRHRLDEQTQVFFSTVFQAFAPARVVERMKQEKLNRIRLQLQLHKFIWNPHQRGV